MDHRGRLIAINDVELQSPVGVDSELAWYYGEFIGLRSLGGSAKIDGPAVLRFRSDRLELRISITKRPVIEPIGCRARFEVPSLDEAAQTLRERRYPFDWLHGLRASDRALLLLDPAGNRVMVRRLWGWYFMSLGRGRRA